MKTNTKKTVLLTLSILLFHAATAAQKSGADNPSAQEIARSGSISESIYKNKLLGFSLSIPDGWEFASEELNKSTLEAGRDLVVAGSTGVSEAEIDRSIAKTSVLFQTFTEAESGSQPIALLSCGVETPQTAGLSAESYLEENKEFLLSAAPGSKITRDTYRSNYGGLLFFSFDIDVIHDGRSVRQTYLVTRHKDVMFFFVMNYRDDVTKEIMKKSLDTLKMEK